MFVTKRELIARLEGIVEDVRTELDLLRAKVEPDEWAPARLRGIAQDVLDLEAEIRERRARVAQAKSEQGARDREVAQRLRERRRE